MQLDEFLDFLTSNDIPFKTTHGSIVLNNCPHCNSSKEKVWLYKDRRNESGPFFGSCMKCSEKVNSRSYLIGLGYPKSMVDALHGPAADNWQLSVAAIDILGDQTVSKVLVEDKEVVEPDISMFLPLDAVKSSDAAKYAIKRGWTENQAESVLIDYYGNAVVFIVRHEGQVVGYQRRFVTPFNPKMKVMSSQDFQKRRFVLEFPNDGDICVTEGPFTALSAWHFGYHAICTFGSNVGEKQIDRMAQLAETHNKKVAVGFDLDSAGKKGYSRIRAAMNFRKIESYRVRPEYGNDLNDSWIAGRGIIVLTPKDEDNTMPMLDLPFEAFI